MSINLDTHIEIFGAAFSEMLTGRKFVDMTLVCEGRRIHCHRLVLAVYSPYLSDLLEENPSHHPIIILPRDMKFWTIQGLVDFMYKGEVRVSNEGFPEFVKWAEVLKIRGFEKLLRNSPVVKIERNQESEAAEELIDEFKAEQSKVEFDVPQHVQNALQQKEVFIVLDREMDLPVESRSTKSHQLRKLKRQSYYELDSTDTETSDDSTDDSDDSTTSKCSKEKRILISPPKYFNLMHSNTPRLYDKKDMWSALMSVKHGMSMTRASEIYKVPYSTLVLYMKRYRRVKN